MELDMNKVVADKERLRSFGIEVDDEKEFADWCDALQKIVVIEITGDEDESTRTEFFAACRKVLPCSDMYESEEELLRGIESFAEVLAMQDEEIHNIMQNALREAIKEFYQRN